MDSTVYVAAIAALGSILSAWLALKAQKNTKPLSNGFAGDVIRRLDRIEGAILNHLEDHAEAELKKRRDNFRRR